MSSTVDDTYVVKLPNGEARVMTVDELDTALDTGMIHAGTPLLAPGSTTWTTLGVLAGLDDVAPPQAPIVPVSPSSLVPVSFAQASVALPDGEDELGLVGRRRVVKVVGLVFGAAAVIAIVFGIQSAISQSIASSAAQAALAAQPPPPPPAPVPPPAPLPPVVAKAPPPPAPAAAPAAAPASAKAKDADKKKGKLPSAPKKKK